MASYVYTFTDSTGKYGVRFTISQTNNEEANTSTISITKFEVLTPGYNSFILDGSLYIGNTRIWYSSAYEGTYTGWCNTWSDQGVTNATTVTVNHADDGSLNLTLTLKNYGSDYTKGFLFMNYNTTGADAWITNGTTSTQTLTENNVGKVRIYTSSGWVSATPYVYTSSGWKKAIPYVYTSSGWTKAK